MKGSRCWHVLGAGAMGTALCHRLREYGADCLLLHHRSRSEARVLLHGEERYSLEAASVTALGPGEIHRLMLTTKAGQLVAALKLARPFLAPGAIVITTANGLGMERELARQHPDIRLTRAVSTAAAYRNVRGEVRVTATGHSRIGNDGAVRAAPAWFIDSLGLLPDWEWCSPIAGAIAEKFAINCVINALTATRRCRNGELLDAGRAGTELRALCAECEPALRRLGLWDGGRSLLDVAVRVCAATRNNRSSMLQDVLAGRTTEIRYLNGELLHRAEAHGLELPLNRKLVDALSHREDQNR